MKLKKNLTSLDFGKTCAGEEAGGQGREGGARRRGGRWPGGRAPCASHLTATAQALLEATGSQATSSALASRTAWIGTIPGSD